MDWKTLLAYITGSVHVLNEYMAHYHTERPHQGKGNVILFPSTRPEQHQEGLVCCHERLGGLLKYYDREAASAMGTS